MTWRWLMVVIGMLVADPALAAAAQVTLSAEARVINDRVAVTIAATNEGTVPIQGLVPRIGATVLPSHPRLGPDEHWQTEAQLPAPAQPGRYHWPLLLDYRHPTGQSVRTVAVLPVHHGKPPPQRLGAHLRPLTLHHGQGRVPMTITNRSQRALEIDVQLLAPLALTLEPNQLRLRLAPGASITRPIMVHAEPSAAAGRHPIHAIATTSITGFHHSQAASAVITVPQTRGAVPRLFAHQQAMKVGIGLLVIWGLAIAGLDAWRHRRRT